MSPSTILALLGVIESIIQDTPQALALFNAIKTMLVNGTEPSADQWSALNTMLGTDHQALQQG